VYTIKIKSGKYKNKKFYLYVKKDVDNKLEYGDLIEFEGKYIIPNQARNYKGFDYREYLKTKKIYGTFKVEDNCIRVIETNNLNYSNKIRKYIINTLDKLLPQRTSKLLSGVLIGEKQEIQDEIIENFRISNLSHMLSVSGAHTSYIILAIAYVLNKNKISKKWIYVITIVILILLMFITNFTVSVTRACIMSIIILISHILHRKADIWTSISISLLIILSINPFDIKEIGFQLSYLATIGIIVFSKNLEDIFIKMKIPGKISKILAVTASAQIAIMPIMMYKFNTVSLTFCISNILATPFLGINILLGFITIFISLISFSLAKMLAVLLNLSLEALIFIAYFVSKSPLSSILVKTPRLFLIILIYCALFTLNYIYSIYNKKSNLKLFQNKRLLKVNKVNLRNVFAVITIVVVVFSSSFLIPKDLRIYFIDVGQGDSCLIVTPNNKKILIDGGEETPEILVPYLLDRRIKKIDYIIISHFDSDHVRSDYLL